MDPWKGVVTIPQSMNKYAYVLNNPVKFIDPLGLNVKENYEYQKRMQYNQLLMFYADPNQSIYLIEEIRVAALDFLHDFMYENGRNGYIDLLDLVKENTLEADAIFGIIRKLTGVKGSFPPRVLDDPLQFNLQGLYTKNNTTGKWDNWIIDERMFSYIKKFSCEKKARVDKGGLAYFDEKNPWFASSMADSIETVAYTVIAYQQAKNDSIKETQYDQKNNPQGNSNTNGGTGNTKLYRAMSEAEYNSMMSNGGKFTQPPGGAMEAKWFATTSQDAAQWGSKFYPNGNYKIIEIELPSNALSKMYYNPYLDGVGPAYSGDFNLMNTLMDGVATIR